MEAVCCRNCGFFVPDPVGDGYGWGECRIYSHYKAKGLAENELNALLARLGNKRGEPLFWGGNLIDRFCEKYEAKN